MTLQINQSLTDTCRVGSPPILNTKGTTQKEKTFLEEAKESQPLLLARRKWEPRGPTKKPREYNTKTHLRG